MYLPEHFCQHDTATLHQLITDHPLGTLVLQSPSGLDANHLPFELQPEKGVLLAHVARANPLWQEAQNGDPALVIFRAAEAYISPNWYPSKHQTHQQVPTWNYLAVHAHGRITIRDDERFVRGVVARLTRTHEQRTADNTPWKMTDSPQDFIKTMLGAIVGIEITIQRLEGKWKLSQNREPQDRQQAATELQQRGEQAMAAAMQATLNSSHD